MATMAPMIAPKGTEVSWNGGNVEKSPEPRNSSFARWKVGKLLYMTVLLDLHKNILGK